MANDLHTSSQHRSSSWTGIIVRSVISLLLITAGALGFVALGRGRAPEMQGNQGSTRPAVEVFPVASHAGGIDFKVDGVVIPFRQIEVPAEVNGRVSFKSDNCRVGHTVKKGEVLLRIDPKDYELEIRRLEEDVKQARANLHELEVETKARARQIELAHEDLVIKKREVERYEKIEDPGVYSKSELDAARLKELQARDAVQTEQDQSDLLEARHDRVASVIELGIAKLEKAKLDLERTEISAPIDGVITGEGPEQGGYVQVGGKIAVIQDTSQMEIRCSLHMQQMNWLWKSPSSNDPTVAARGAYQLPETPATIVFHVEETEYRWSGNLAYFDGAQVDQQTRMVPCRVYVENPRDVTFDGAEPIAAASAPITLMTGMFVTVHIHASPQLSLLQFPVIAVQPGNHIWVVRPDDDAKTDDAKAGDAKTGKVKTGEVNTGDPQARTGRLHRCAIRVAQSTPDRVLAYASGSDLNAGDLVVISPLASPTENATVEILEAK